MSDLRHHFEKIAGPVPAQAAPAAVEADLTRGRRALRRRRTVQSIAGSAFGVAALAAAFAVATSGTSESANAPIAQGPAAESRAVASPVAVQLVAYKGEQPKGFTVDKVPSGWYIQGDDAYSLVIAPKNTPTAVPSSAGLNDPHSFVGKIAVMLESKDQSGPSREGKKVKVGDQDGLLLKSLNAVNPDGSIPTATSGDTGWELWVKQPSGVYMIIQVW